MDRTTKTILTLALLFGGAYLLCDGDLRCAIRKTLMFA
jgi:hypothetical protein